MIWIFYLMFGFLFWMFLVWDGTGWRDFDGLTAGCMCMQNNKTGVSGNAGRSLESEDLAHESILILHSSALICAIYTPCRGVLCMQALIGPL